MYTCLANGVVGELSVHLPRPFPAGRFGRGRLGRNDDFDLSIVLPRGLLLLLAAREPNGHSRLLAVRLAPEHPHLRAQHAVEKKRERKARGHERVAHFSRGREEPREAPCDLGDDREGRELACALRAVVLVDLGQLREERDGERCELEKRKARCRHGQKSECGDGNEHGGKRELACAG